MQQTVRIACRGLERVAERMPEVQQRPLALFGFVAPHDGGLHLDRAGHRADPGIHVARRSTRGIGLEPFEELVIPQQTVFDHLAVSGQEIACG